MIDESFPLVSSVIDESFPLVSSVMYESSQLVSSVIYESSPPVSSVAFNLLHPFRVYLLIFSTRFECLTGKRFIFRIQTFTVEIFLEEC